LLLQNLQLILSFSYLLMQHLQFSRCLISIEVVFTLCEELLLRYIEELLIAETKLPLHVSYLLSQTVILILYRGKVLEPVELAPSSDWLTLNREGI
jgi:hypothetical protein